MIGRFIQEDSYLGDGLNLFAYCQNNPLVYFDPTGHNSEGFMTKLTSNYELLVRYKMNGNSLTEKDKQVNIVTISEQQLEDFAQNKPSGDDVVTINFRLDGKKALKANESGDLGLLVEHMVEQNIVLNDLSLHQTEVLDENIRFLNEVYTKKCHPDNEASKDMVDEYRSAANSWYKKNPDASSGHAPHALDTVGGGAANTFLEDRRNGYANSTMGSSWKNHYNEIEPGSEHLLNLVVKTKNENGKNVEMSLNDFLAMNNTKLNTSKMKVGNLL